MKILLSTSVFALFAAVALPSQACDRHGGMFGQLSGASWTDYNPATAESDALFLEQQLSKWHEQNAEKPAIVKPTKPSFSNASNRASIAAQARIAKRAQEIAKTSEKVETVADAAPKVEKSTDLWAR